MLPLDLVRLTPLMQRVRGDPSISIGLIDGPVEISDARFAGGRLRQARKDLGGACARADSGACIHGTCIATILAAQAASPHPGICPDCTLLLRPIFLQEEGRQAHLPSASPRELAEAIVDCVQAGARVINLSLGTRLSWSPAERILDEALDYALRQNVLVIAAAGNQGGLGSSSITRHGWVIPVMACDLDGRLSNDSNFGTSIARNGLCAPGEGLAAVTHNGQAHAIRGTSVATAVVTGAIALLWTAFPSASSAEIRAALLFSARRAPASLIAPLLDAEAAYAYLSQRKPRRQVA